MKKQVRVRISRYDAGKGLSCAQDVDKEIQQRLSGKVSYKGPDKKCTAIRERLRNGNYQSIGQVVENMSPEEYNAFRKNYLRKARS